MILKLIKFGVKQIIIFSCIIVLFVGILIIWNVVKEAPPSRLEKLTTEKAAKKALEKINIQYSTRKEEIFNNQQEIINVKVNEKLWTTDHGPRIMVVDIGDPKDIAVDTIKSVIEADDELELVTSKKICKAFSKLSFDDFKKSISNIIDTAKFDAVLMVSDVIFSENKKKAETEITLTLRQCPKMNLIAEQKSVYTLKKAWYSPLWVGIKIKESSKWMRMLFWIFAAGLLPWLLYPVLNFLLKRGSNAVNFIILLGLTIIDILLAFALSGFTVMGFFDFLGIILALALGAAYNYFVLESIQAD